MSPRLDLLLASTKAAKDSRAAADAAKDEADATFEAQLAELVATASAAALKRGHGGALALRPPPGTRPAEWTQLRTLVGAIVAALEGSGAEAVLSECGLGLKGIDFKTVGGGATPWRVQWFDEGRKMARCFATPLEAAAFFALRFGDSVAKRDATRVTHLSHAEALAAAKQEDLELWEGEGGQSYFAVTELCKRAYVRMPALVRWAGREPEEAELATLVPEGGFGSKAHAALAIAQSALGREARAAFLASKAQKAEVQVAGGNKLKSISISAFRQLLYVALLLPLEFGFSRSAEWVHSTQAQLPRKLVNAMQVTRFGLASISSVLCRIGVRIAGWMVPSWRISSGIDAGLLTVYLFYFALLHWLQIPCDSELALGAGVTEAVLLAFLASEVMNPSGYRLWLLFLPSIVCVICCDDRGTAAFGVVLCCCKILATWTVRMHRFSAQVYFDHGDHLVLPPSWTGAAASATFVTFISLQAVWAPVVFIGAVPIPFIKYVHLPLPVNPHLAEGWVSTAAALVLLSSTGTFTFFYAGGWWWARPSVANMAHAMSNLYKGTPGVCRSSMGHVTTELNLAGTAGVPYELPGSAGTIPNGPLISTVEIDFSLDQVDPTPLEIRPCHAGGRSAVRNRVLFVHRGTRKVLSTLWGCLAEIVAAESFRRMVLAPNGVRRAARSLADSLLALSDEALATLVSINNGYRYTKTRPGVGGVPDMPICVPEWEREASVLRETGELPTDASLLPPAHLTEVPPQPSAIVRAELERLAAEGRRQLSSDAAGSGSAFAAEQKRLRIDGPRGALGHLGLLVAQGYTGLLRFVDTSLVIDADMYYVLTLAMDAGTAP